LFIFLIEHKTNLISAFTKANEIKGENAATKMKDFFLADYEREIKFIKG